jgi:hypothetical protein
MGRSIKFWLECPEDLFRNLTLLPQHKNSFEEKLNCVTRLVILIAIIMYLLQNKNWCMFLVTSLSVLVAIYLMKPQTQDLIEHFNEDMNNFTYYGDDQDVSESDVLIQPNIQDIQNVQITIKKERDLSKVPLEELYTHILMPEVPFQRRKAKTAYEHMQAANQGNEEEDDTIANRKMFSVYKC